MIRSFMTYRRFSGIWFLTHIGALLPLALLLLAAISQSLTVNPIQDITLRTGKAALIMLVLSLACTPANTLVGFRAALKMRRTLGLYAFYYAFGHFLIFIGLDYTFNWDLLKGAIFEKRFVLVGLSALLILTALAVTSFVWWQKRLGKNWKRLHQLVYLASGLVIFHFAWAKKADISRLQGDIFQPVAFGIVVALLLVLRIPGVRKWLAGLRGKLTRWLNTKTGPSVDRQEA